MLKIGLYLELSSLLIYFCTAAPRYVAKSPQSCPISKLKKKIGLFYFVEENQTPRATARLSSQDGASQQQETTSLSLPQLNRLIEASFVRDESSVSNLDAIAIPLQHRVTLQILNHWYPFQDLKLMFAGSYRVEQLSLRSQQRVVATVEESVLKTEMEGLESQEEDTPERILFFKPMSWLGKIRTHRRDESWSASLWQTFSSTSMGAQIPAITEKPLATCGSRKFQLDPLGDHLNTCTAHSGAKKAHDWMVDQVADFFRRTHKVKTQQVVKNRGQYCVDTTVQPSTLFS
jgi:hypothetical protein